MNTPDPTRDRIATGHAATPRPRLHPLVATAAIEVIALCAVGITTLVMNRSGATPSPSPYDAPAVGSTAAPADATPAGGPATTASIAPSASSRDLASQSQSLPRSPSQPQTPVYDAPQPPPRDETPDRVAAAEPACRDCGTVEAVHDIRVKGRATGVGAVGGAVVGGLLGNVVGAGRGKALATVAGAVGGGLGGNAIEKNVRAETEYQLIVRLDHGGTRTFTLTNPPPYGVGERVRIVDGRVERA